VFESRADEAAAPASAERIDAVYQDIESDIRSA